MKLLTLIYVLNLKKMEIDNSVFLLIKNSNSVEHNGISNFCIPYSSKIISNVIFQYIYNLKAISKKRPHKKENPKKNENRFYERIKVHFNP